MPSFRLAKSEVRPLTPELAKQFDAMSASPTERVKQHQRVLHLREKFEHGLAVTFQWSVARLVNTNDVIRMNGQHSSAALVELIEKDAFPTGCMVHYDEYEVDDLEGAAHLFRQFDDRKSSRTPVDISAVYQGLQADLADLDRGVAKLGVEAVLWHRKVIEGVTVPAGDDAYTMFGEAALHPFLLWLGGIFSIKTPELRHSAIVGAMYQTYTVNPQQATTFWQDVARGGQEFEDNHPTRTLDEWLQSLIDPKRDRGETVKAGDRYNGCVYAWTASREGRSITSIRYQPKKATGRRASSAQTRMAV